MIAKIRKCLIACVTSIALSSCDVGNYIETLSPSKEQIHELLQGRGGFYVDVNHMGFLDERVPSLLHPGWNYQMSEPKIGKIDHTLADGIHHYVAEISFKLESSTKGLEVTGKIWYRRDFRNDTLYFEEVKWKQTGAKKTGKW